MLAGNMLSEFIIKLNDHGYLSFIPDEMYLKFLYYYRTGGKINLQNPVTFNEKLQWMKLFDRNPLYTVYADKYLVKTLVSQIIGERYVIPTLGRWNKYEDINIDTLPNKFVLKCTHDSGGIYICKDRKEFNNEEAKNALSKSLNRNYYWQGRQWAYKNIKPQIIAERLIEDRNNPDLYDYKVFCFDGIPRLIQVDFDRFTNHRRNIYSTDWQYMDVSIKYPNDPEKRIPRPTCLDKLLDLSRKLSKGFRHVRTDFYIIHDEDIYFGEMTFYHGAGYESFTPYSFGEEVGNWFNIESTY